MVGWELKLDDLRGGYLQVGDFARGANLYDGDYRAFASTTLDHRWRRHLILPAKHTQQTNFTLPAASTNNAVFFAYLNRALYLGRGGTAGHCLYYETSAVDPTLLETDFNPGGSYISGLYPIVIGGATQATRLMIMLNNASPVVVTISGTAVVTDGTMHANLAGTFGVITSPVNATTPGTGTHLIRANNKLYALAVSAAITDAPTQVLSNLYDGGYALGLMQLPKGPWPLRAYWAEAVQDNSIDANNDSVLTPSTTTPFPLRLMHTNLEGGDPQWPEIEEMPFFYFGCIWQGQHAQSNGAQVIVYDGEKARDLHIFDNRAADSNYKWSVVKLGTRGRDLTAVVLRSDLTGSSLDVLTMEQYLPGLDAWLPISGNLTLGTITYNTNLDRTPVYMSSFVTNYGPGIPISKQTGFAHLAMNGPKWDRLYVQPSAHNPFYQLRQTGAAQRVAQDFESPGTATLPYFELPQLEGRWKKVDTVVFMGDVDSGGTGATVGVAINGGSAINFATGMTGGTNVVQTADTGDNGLWMQLQVAITLTRGSTTTKTPNGLPLLLRGRAYLTDPNTQQLGVPPGP